MAFCIIDIFACYVSLNGQLTQREKILFRAEPSNEEKNILQEHKEIFSNLLTQEKEIVVLQEVFLEKQENFLEKLELINPDIAEDLIQEVLGKVLKNIFARDQLSLIDLKYLKEKRLYLKEKRLQREQEIREEKLRKEREEKLRKEQEEKLRKEREEKIKNQNSYKPSQNYSNSSWPWGNDNKEINVKGHYRKNGTYVKPYKRRK